MPGIAGLVSDKLNFPAVNLKSMLGVSEYGRAVITESYQDGNISMGCSHLGTGGQRVLYQSDLAVVVFYGYLTSPAIPPGIDQPDNTAAAHYIHDLYLMQGEGMMRQIAGAFTFSLWDKRSKTLLLVSDHLGLRPVYFYGQSGSFHFASEVKGLLIDPTIPRRINLEAIADFFHFSYILGNKTFFEDIQMLPPATILRFHDGRYTTIKYWDVSYPECYKSHPDSWYNELIFNALKNAVQRMANPRIHYGLSLSGGMDLRWIAAFLSQVQPSSSSFTVGVPGSDDTLPARAVAACTGLPNNYWTQSYSSVADLAETYSYISDGMYDLFSIEEFPLSVKVGDYVDVSVGGFLGDCLFGHEINPVSANLRKQDVKRYWLWRNRDAWISKSLGTKVFGDNTYKILQSLATASLEKGIASAPTERGFQILQYFNIRNRQPRYINIAQQAKMVYVDIYHPIADLEVVQAALQLPPDQLMMERAYRRAMATYFPDLATIPWTFTLTPPTVSVPAIILKKAAQLSLGRWLRKTRFGNHPLIRPRRYYSNYSLWSRGPLRTFIEKTLLSPEADATGLFNMDGLRKLVQDHMEHKLDATTFIGQALAVALWTRIFFLPPRPSFRPVFIDNSRSFILIRGSYMSHFDRTRLTSRFFSDPCKNVRSALVETNA